MMRKPRLVPELRNSVAQRLLRWFSRHARDLPWRRRRDPYAIWVSEVMLQQTQVSTVIPYFNRFICQFPDIATLAGADEQVVLRAWEGLGYYRRGRFLHQAARQLRDKHACLIPDDPALLAALPGFGRYTVNAVLSQAYERPLPILEANSRRVLCRLIGVRTDPNQKATQDLLWHAAAALLPARRIGDFNQALMELGALVCTPTNPACRQCPLARRCRAHRLGEEGRIPIKAARPRPVEVREVAVAVRRKGRVLLVRLPADAERWAGLWELPRRAIAAGSSAEQTAAQLLRDLGLKAKLEGERMTLRHSVTRFRIALTCMQACYRVGKVRLGAYAACTWLRPAELANYPLSRPQRQLADALRRPRSLPLF